MELSRTKTWIIALSFLAMVALPPVTTAMDQTFYMTLFGRIMIFAIAAMSLDLILGFGGMISFGHAAYLGLGSYAVGILAFHGISNGWAQLAVAIGGSAATRFAT